MTLDELNSLRGIDKEINDLEKRIEELNAAADGGFSFDFDTFADFALGGTYCTWRPDLSPKRDFVLYIQAGMYSYCTENGGMQIQTLCLQAEKG